MIKYILDELKKDQPFDARELCSKYTTDVVSNAIFGIDAQSFTQEKPEIREVGRRLMKPTTSFVIESIIKAFFPIFNNLIKSRWVSTDVEEFFMNLMDQALKYREEGVIKREDFLDYLIQLKNKKNISKLEMTAHTVTFFSDGFDTSSIAIASTLYEVGRFRVNLCITNILNCQNAKIRLKS